MLMEWPPVLDKARTWATVASRTRWEAEAADLLPRNSWFASILEVCEGGKWLLLGNDTRASCTDAVK